MDERDERTGRWLQRFDKNRGLYIYTALILYLFLNGVINASSVIMEDSRDGVRTFSNWEPLVWELTSAIAVIIILPFIFKFFAKNPLRFSHLGRQILLHIGASILFSVAHVGLMVAMREGIYWFNGGNYNFSPWLREFFYEYRKDALGYLTWLVIYQLVSALFKRLKGEASLINDEQSQNETEKMADESSATTKPPEHLLVRKLDKEFLVKVADIEWMESSGNYVNLYQKGRIYPLRGTLTNTLERFGEGFSRIHRSFAVNHSAINSIQYSPSGDGVVTLKTGQELSISRRYKLDFKNALG